MAVHIVNRNNPKEKVTSLSRYHHKIRNNLNYQRTGLPEPSKCQHPAALDSL